MDESEATSRFEELYASAYRKVLAFARQRTANLEDAYEVVSETFLVAWRRLEDALSADNSLAWLYGVAYRVLANQRRQQRRQGRLEARIEAQADIGIQSLTPRGLEDREILAEVTRILDELPTKYQEVLRLTAYQDCSPAEIASILQVHPSVARTRLYRARLRLRRILDKRQPGWGVVLEESE